jgi:hypothetical protein
MVLGRTNGVHEVVAGGRRVQSRVVEPVTVGRVAQALIVGHGDDVSERDACRLRRQRD